MDMKDARRFATLLNKKRKLEDGLAEVKEDYNTSTFSAWVRERLANGQALPPTIAEVVEVQEQVTLRGRRTPASPQSKSAKAISTIRR